MSTEDQRPCGEEYERPGGRQPGDRIVRCNLPAGHSDEHEETETGSKWWGRHTPGRGWQRVRKELPGIVPDLTEEDFRRADELIAAAERHYVTTPDQPTPGQLASFDQTHAAIGANIDACIDMYRAELADGHSAELTLAGLAEWLVQASGLDHVAMADHLAVAVGRLFEAHAAPAAAFHDGVAEGRRQATEGLAREWGVTYPARRWPLSFGADAEEARSFADRRDDRSVVSRLVGPWDTTGQAEDDAHMAAMEERHQHEDEQAGSDRG